MSIDRGRLRLPELTELTAETPPTADEMRARLRELQRHRMTLTEEVTRELGLVDRQLARLGEWLDVNTTPSADAVEGRQACQILGISYHTLRAHLRQPNGARTTGLPSDAVVDDGRG